MFHLNLKKVCANRGKHLMSRLSQNAPWLNGHENAKRAFLFGPRRYWHSQCRLCGAMRTVSIDELKPGAKESKRLTRQGAVFAELRETLATTSTAHGHVQMRSTRDAHID